MDSKQEESNLQGKKTTPYDPQKALSGESCQPAWKQEPSGAGQPQLTTVT